MGKHYEVIKRKPDTGFVGVDMGGSGGKVEWGKGRSTARITDEALAKDIAQEFGQENKGREAQVLVAEVPDRNPDRIVTTGTGDGKWDEIRAQKKKPNERIKEKH